MGAGGHLRGQFLGWWVVGGGVNIPLTQFVSSTPPARFSCLFFLVSSLLFGGATLAIIFYWVFFGTVTFYIGFLYNIGARGTPVP